MKIILIAFGSRGDVQPILALAHGLAAAGYTVTIGAGTNFQDWIEGEGFDFAPISVDMQALMRSELGRSWIEESSRNPLKEMQAMRATITVHSEQVTADLARMCAEADVLVSGLPSYSIVQTIAERSDKPHITIMLTPFKPARDPVTTLVPSRPRQSSSMNRLSGRIGIFLLWTIFRRSTNTYRRQIGLNRWNYLDYLRSWVETPTIYGVSPHLVPPQDDWGGYNKVTGYWYFDQAADWQPPDDLRAFLAAGEPPVYLGFGSMASSQPDTTMRLIREALERTGQRGIIGRGWTDMGQGALSDTLFLLDKAPHDWLFPRMAAVVHHGGAGTTAVAVRAGVPNVAIAHMADQPYWGRRLHEVGVGPPMIRRHQLTVDSLAQAIARMVTDQEMQRRAQELGEAVACEKGVDNAVAAFDEILGQTAQLSRKVSA